MKTSFTENNKIRYLVDTTQYSISHTILSKVDQRIIIIANKSVRGIIRHSLIKIHFNSNEYNLK